MKWDRLPTKTIERLQNEKLHRYLNEYLYPFSAYYRDLFKRHRIDPRKIKSVRDLKDIPFTTKRDLLPTPENPDRFRDYILQPEKHLIREYWPKRKLLSLVLRRLLRGENHLTESLEREFLPMFLIATTGRTASPLSFFYTLYDLDLLKLAGGRLAETLGIERRHRAVNLFPYVPHLAFWQVAFAGFEQGNFILHTGGGKVFGTKANIASIERIRPQVLIGVPGYIYHILRAARSDGRNFSSVNKVVLGAERVTFGLKEKMANLLQAMGAETPRVMGTYGFTEARMALAECPTALSEYSGYHTYPDLVVFEVIHPETGEVVGEGEDGELVYTGIDGRGTVVLRFRTGDYVRGGMVKNPCPHCGRTVPRISSDITRVSNIQEIQLTKVRGTLVDLNLIMEILSSDPSVEEWQIEIGKKDEDPFEMDEVTVYLALKDGTDPALAEIRLKEKFLEETQITPNRFIFQTLQEILQRLGMETELKEKRILDRRPRS